MCCGRPDGAACTAASLINREQVKANPGLEHPK